MSDDERGARYSDPEMEAFFRENRKMLEKILAEERDLLMKAARAEKARAEEFIGDKREKARAAASDFASAICDPEVQRHFASAGIELFLGISALAHAAPMPGRVREFMEGAERQAKKSAGAAMKAECAAEKSVRKVEIASAAPEAREGAGPDD
jgi:hypothetical protein